MWIAGSACGNMYIACHDNRVVECSDRSLRSERLRHGLLQLREAVEAAFVHVAKPVLGRVELDPRSERDRVSDVVAAILDDMACDRHDPHMGAGGLSSTAKVALATPLYTASATLPKWRSAGGSDHRNETANEYGFVEVVALAQEIRLLTHET